MAEKGLVVELKDNLAIIRMIRTEACAKCRACIAGMSEKEMFIEAENICDAKVDDWVEIELHDNGFYSAVLIMYGIPLVALIAGILFGYYVITPFFNMGSIGEVVSFGIGMLFTGLTYLWIRSQEKRWESKKYRPIATKITVSD